MFNPFKRKLDYNLQCQIEDAMEEAYAEGKRDGIMQERKRRQREEEREAVSKTKPITERQKETLLRLVYLDKDISVEFYEPVVNAMNSLEAEKAIKSFKQSNRRQRHRGIFIGGMDEDE